MASEIRVNKITNRSGLTTTTLLDTGVDVVGLVTASGYNVGTGLTARANYIGLTGDISATGVITATSFVGNVTGNLSGDIVGTRTLGTGVTVTAAGVVSATTYYGDGSNLTNITTTTINNNANNRIITGSGTANTLEGESTLTYDGSLLVVTGDVALPTTKRMYFGNSDTAFIKGEHGGSAYLAFGANNEQMRMTRTGRLGIGTEAPSNSLEIRTNLSTTGRVDAHGYMCRDNWGTHTNIGNGMFSPAINTLAFATNSGERVRIGAAGTVTPSADNTQDLGSPAKRWANVYTGDLHLSNSGAGNSVDGTSGSWTMQEGESDLFLINNNTGKKYKFNLTEVS